MIENSLWVEKYRPNVLRNYVGNEHLKGIVSTIFRGERHPKFNFLWTRWYRKNYSRQTFG